MKLIYPALALCLAASPIAAESHGQQQATCYYSITGDWNGSDWGNQANGTPSGSWFQDNYSGDYAYLFIVNRDGDNYSCPVRLNVGCSDCRQVSPVWE
ncbi:hypothetical protein [Nioella aestuarii]|uniref:hypothetical protein n=1 Tax=Nioella aestuarii TaxID=1662864 RepID=UPI003D7F6174